MPTMAVQRQPWKLTGSGVPWPVPFYPLDSFSAWPHTLAICPACLGSSAKDPLIVARAARLRR